MGRVPILLPAAFLLLPLASCRSAQSSSQALAAPMDVSGELETVWEYLVLKYDTNRDGRIVEAEYRREGKSFARLDLNGDAALTEADFDPDAGGAMSFRSGEMGALLSVMIYFQGDEQHQQLTLLELEDALHVYDGNMDNTIDEAEFGAQAEERRAALSDSSRLLAGMMRDTDPWAAMAEYVDENSDGAIAAMELFLFFEKHADGGEVWDFSGPEGDGERQAMSGPAPGTVAPDFLLQPPEGGDEVSLSSFRGKRPVALIFGSYT